MCELCSCAICTVRRVLIKRNVRRSHKISRWHNSQICNPFQKWILADVVNSSVMLFGRFDARHTIQYHAHALAQKHTHREPRASWLTWHECFREDCYWFSKLTFQIWNESDPCVHEIRIFLFFNWRIQCAEMEIPHKPFSIWMKSCFSNSNPSRIRRRRQSI